jgi:hypothetical protein
MEVGDSAMVPVVASYSCVSANPAHKRPHSAAYRRESRKFFIAEMRQETALSATRVLVNRLVTCVTPCPSPSGARLLE